MHQERDSINGVLAFACPGCPYSAQGRCTGPPDAESYLMQGDYFASCINPIRRGQFYLDVYSRVVPIPDSSNQESIKLPSFIPQVESGLDLSALRKVPLFAVSLGKIIGERGDLLVNSIEDVRKRFKLPPNARVGLIGTAKDYKIENLWKISDARRISQRIADIGFDFVTSPTFSVCDKEPRFDQIRNQDRNLQFHDILANLGVPSIPFLFPYNQEDYDFTGKWLRERPDIKIVGVLAQFYKTSQSFQQFLKNTKAIQDAAQRPLHFLVVGAALKTSIFSIMKDFQATIVTGKPFNKARAGVKCNDELKDEKSDMLREDLALFNILKYQKYCDSLCQRIAKNHTKKIKRRIYDLPRKMELPKLFKI